MKKIVLIAITAIISSCNAGGNKSSRADSGAESNIPAITDTATTITSVDTTVSNFVRNAMIMNMMEIETSKIAQKQARNSGVKDFADMMVTEHTNANNQLKSLAGQKKIEIPMMPGTIAGKISATGESRNNNTEPSVAATSGGSGSRASGGSNTSSSSATGNNATIAANAGTNVAQGNNKPAPAITSGVSTGYGTSVSGSESGTNTAQMSGVQNSPVYKEHQIKLTRLRSKTGGDFDRQYMQMMIADCEKVINLFSKATGNTDADVKAFATEMLPVFNKHKAAAQNTLKSIK
ncbi:MAG: DUF4142 domain-containing protein [Flavobacterium sp.]|nr:DUF4142 domain-containing protein [Pedobacter sp.]